MENLSIFEVITVAIRRRLLWPSEAKYCEALGIKTLDTLRNNRESPRELSFYFDVLSDRCREICGESLYQTVTDFVKTSEFFASGEWGANKHLTSKRRFCRMLFRLYACGGQPLTQSERLKFSPKAYFSDEDDARITSMIFPEGMNADPAINPAFLLLFAFDVLKPCKDIEKGRGHDLPEKEIISMLMNMRTLVELLKNDMPRIGSTDKPIVFRQTLDIIDSRLEDSKKLAEIIPLHFMQMLRSIIDSCRGVAVTSSRAVVNNDMLSYDMPGIWIDDADEGRERFWVFPDNIMAAMCFCREGAGWKMLPYEFRVQFAEDQEEYYDSFMMITPEANRNFTIHSDYAIPVDEYAVGFCSREAGEEMEDAARVRIVEGATPLPSWLDFREWTRLSPADGRYKECRAVMNAIFDPENPQSRLYRNVAPELTDTVNNLVGRDNKYLYIFDWNPRDFGFIERKEGRFAYIWRHAAENMGLGLFELPISAEHPLYAIPLNVKRNGSKEADKLVELMADADNITTVTILHSDACRKPVLLFGDHSITIPLDMEILAEAGVRKIIKKI